MITTIAWLLLVFYVLLLLYDWLFLYCRSKPTISQVYHALFPQWFDYVVMITFVSAYTLVVCEYDIVLQGGQIVLMGLIPGIIISHFCWHEDNFMLIEGSLWWKVRKFFRGLWTEDLEKWE